MAASETGCSEFATRYRGMFADGARLTAATLHEALVAIEALAERMGRLGSYCGLVTAADTDNDEFRKLEDRVRTALVSRENELTFFELGWLGVARTSRRN